jgi:hypothetical protein
MVQIFRPTTTEKVYIVISRELLKDIPSGHQLIAYCAGKTDCKWKPTDNLWAKLTEQAKEPVLVAKSNNYGEKMDSSPADYQRRLDVDAPVPSVIVTSDSAREMLIMVVNLRYGK